jgi:hypothetical protein
MCLCFFILRLLTCLCEQERVNQLAEALRARGINSTLGAEVSC